MKIFQINLFNNDEFIDMSIQRQTIQKTNISNSMDIFDAGE